MLIFISIFVLIMLVSLLKKSELIVFDKNTTIPLRGILILIIFCGHAFSLAHLHYPLVEWMFQMELAVGVFFFLSGYGLMVSFKKRGLSYLSGFIPRAASKLLLPALVLGGLWQIYLFFNQGTVSPIKDMIFHGKPPLPASWFVIELFCLYVMFWGCVVFCHGKLLSLAICGMSQILIGILIVIPGWGPHWWSATLAFPIGIAYAEYQDAIDKRKLFITLTVAIILLVSGACCQFVRNAIAYNGARVLCNGVFGVCCIEIMSKLKFSSLFFKFIGKISYEIYLTHVCILLMFLPIRQYACLYLMCSLCTTVAVAVSLNMYLGTRVAHGGVRCN